MNESDPAQPAAKVDPETLAIRARPQRAIRFRRGLIIGIAGLGSASLMTVAWIALKPRVISQVAATSELSEPNTRAASDALGDLPASYGDAPRLGPPLPGDLGRPILKAQREMATENGVGQKQLDSAAAERSRIAAEMKAARESGLLVQSGGRSSSGEAGQISAVASTLPNPGGTSPPLTPSRDPGGQQAKSGFLGALDKSGDVNPHPLTPPASPYMLAAGSVIAASLITGINSDLPGLVTAQVTQNVFDSATGHILLVPQGARLIGRYDSVVAFGQQRALVIWQRIILPDGSSLRLDNATAADPAGYAGLADKVDFHSWSLLKGVAMATLLGVGSELSVSGESDLVEAIRESTQQNVARAGDQLVSRNLDVQPTITIRPGAPVRLLVSRDIILAPWPG